MLLAYQKYFLKIDGVPDVKDNERKIIFNKKIMILLTETKTETKKKTEAKKLSSQK